jgi:HNH endonuclease
MAWKGDIPPTMTIDHLCKNQRCFNPAHLEPTSNRTNNRRAMGIKVPDDRCKNGHPYVVGSHRITNRNRIICRICETERTRQRREAGKIPNWQHPTAEDWARVDIIKAGLIAKGLPVPKTIRWGPVPDDIHIPKDTPFTERIEQGRRTIYYHTDFMYTEVGEGA